VPIVNLYVSAWDGRTLAKGVTNGAGQRQASLNFGVSVVWRVQSMKRIENALASLVLVLVSSGGSLKLH